MVGIVRYVYVVFVAFLLVLTIVLSVADAAVVVVIVVAAVFVVVGRIPMKKNDNDNESSAPPRYIYVFNGFFMSMRNKFVGPTNSIHCYVVEWDPKVLSWKSFRNDILGYVIEDNLCVVLSVFFFAVIIGFCNVHSTLSFLRCPKHIYVDQRIQMKHQMDQYVKLYYKTTKN